MECPVQSGSRAVSRSVSSSCPGTEGADVDVKLPVLLLTLAGVALLLLLYRLLQLRHRLKMARARHALEYHGFYHSATYRLQHVPLHEDEALVRAVTPPAVVVTAPPPPPMTRLPAPVSPPSPRLSCGACSDADLYSRIGAFRPSSRLSSLSSQSRVVLFEHAAL